MTVVPDEPGRGWMDTEIALVVPGVYRIPLPLELDGLRAINSYVIVDGDHLVVIDAGWDQTSTRDRLTSALSRLGVELGDVTQFLVTHAHKDHYTMANALRETHGTVIAMGEAERLSMETLSRRPSYSVIPQVPLLEACGAGDLAALMLHIDDPFDASEWQLPDTWLPDGSLIELDAARLRAVHTPGHTRGHFVFHDEERGLLFAGDHVLPHITPSLAFEQCPGDRPLGAYLDSLGLMLSLPDARLLAGHGPSSGRVHVRAQELIEHHRVRLADCAAQVASGASTAFEVAAGLPWTSREKALPDLDGFNQALAVIETLWHLRHLAEAGDVIASTDAGGVEHYSRSP